MATAKQKAAARKNIKKAIAANRKRGRKVKSKKPVKRTAKQIHRAHVRAGKKGARLKKFRKELRSSTGITKADLNAMTGSQFTSALGSMSDDEYTAAAHSNPFRKGKSRPTTRPVGMIFHRKGKLWIVTKTKNGKKIARRWANKIRR